MCVQRLAGLFLVGSNRMLLLTVQHYETQRRVCNVLYAGSLVCYTDVCLLVIFMVP